MREGRVEDLYAQVKEMAVTYRIRPGERINEVALARSLEASRTPLREALNRLVTERLIEFRPGAGFFCRDLDAQTVFELYELREILEIAAVRRACARGDSEAIAALGAELRREGLDYRGRSVREVTERDEAFHIGIAALTGNAELVRELGQINERIRFIRWVDMAERVATTKGEHLAIMEAIEARDPDRAAEVMRSHIVKRMDQIVSAVKEGYSSIYVNGPEELFERLIGAEE